MDIWGTKAARLQKELDQAREDLREAREMLNGVTAIVEDTADEAKKDNSKIESGASILFMQNRRKKTASLDNA